MRKLTHTKHILRGIAFVVVCIGGASAIVMLLWNALIPELIGWGAVNYWQAAGLLILCRLLFCGLGNRHGHHHPFGGRRGHWNDPRFGEMHEKFHEETKDMSRAEKIEYIRKRMGEHRHAGMPHE